MKKFILIFMVLAVLCGCGYNVGANKASYSEATSELSEIEQENQRCYDAGYEAGFDAGLSAVIENPHEYELIEPAEMVVSVIDAGYEDFAREIWGDEAIDEVYYGIEPSIDPNLFSNSNN